MYLEDLPNELLDHILSFLDAKSLTQASQVSSRFRGLVNGVWKRVYFRDFAYLERALWSATLFRERCIRPLTTHLCNFTTYSHSSEQQYYVVGSQMFALLERRLSRRDNATLKYIPQKGTYNAVCESSNGLVKASTDGKITIRQETLLKNVPGVIAMKAIRNQLVIATKEKFFLFNIQSKVQVKEYANKINGCTAIFFNGGERLGVQNNFMVQMEENVSNYRDHAHCTLHGNTLLSLSNGRILNSKNQLVSSDRNLIYLNSIANRLVSSDGRSLNIYNSEFNHRKTILLGRPISFDSDHTLLTVRYGKHLKIYNLALEVEALRCEHPLGSTFLKMSGGYLHFIEGHIGIALAGTSQE